MTDIRTRLADALQEASGKWMTAEVENRDENLEQPYYVYMAQALLSLPGIAIVELPEEDEDAGWSAHNSRWFSYVGEGDDGRIGVRPHLSCDWLHPAAARRFAAALLAAADAAEAAPARAWNGEGPWPGDNILGAWR